MKPKTLKPLVAALLVPLVGCVVVAPQSVSLPERRPLGRGLPGYAAPLEPSASSSAAPALVDPTGVLTLQQVLALALLHNPELAASSWEIRAAEARTLQASLRQAKLDLEKANARADLTLSGGVKYLNEPDDGAFIVGVGVPLPLFDRNQGGIREAKVELAKAGEERRAAETEVTAELGAAYEELASAYEGATALKQDVLPAAKAAHGAVQEGYRQGKFGFLDVLDAQRTLFEAGQKHIDALASYHQALAEVEGLIGQSLATVNEQPK